MTKFKKNLDCLRQTNITDVITNKNSHPMLLKANIMDVGDKTKYQVSSLILSTLFETTFAPNQAICAICASDFERRFIQSASC